MSSFKDAMSAIKSVILMQSDIENLRKDIGELSSNVGGLKIFAHEIDKRVVRIETMIEMTSRGGQTPRLESN